MSAKVSPGEVHRTGLDVALKDVRYSVKTSSGLKEIVKGVSVRAKPGRILAVMGPSGSGKTSLLNLMGGKMPLSSGEISINHNPVPRSTVLAISSYVEQDDKLLSTLTVRETLYLAARLQLPPSKYTDAQKVSTADEVMHTLRLTKAADTRVGDPGEGIIGVSGGERKRCAVGIALVKNPHLLLCDEPTSGLDSTTAYIIIQTLRDLARIQNRTIVVTIHQPSSDVFALFDDLLILQNGNVVYFGEAEQSLDYFESIGFRCPVHYNPADYFFMSVLSLPVAEADVQHQVAAPPSPQKRRGSKAQEELEGFLAASYKKSENAASMAKYFSEKPDESSLQELNVNEFSNKGGLSLFHQFRLLSSRALKQLTRNKMRGRARLGQALAFALIISSIYWGVSNDQKGLQNRSGVAFFVVINTFMGGCMSVVTTFSNERATYVREYQGGLYSTLPYFAAKMMIETPAFLFNSFLNITIIYFAVGFQNDVTKYINAVCVVLGVQLSANSLGILAASFFSRIEVAMALLPLIIVPMMLFSGFFLNAESVPVYFRWIAHISPINYGFTALAKNEFRGLQVTCSEADRQQINITAMTSSLVCEPPSLQGANASLNNPYQMPNMEQLLSSCQVANSSVCRFSSGDEFLETFNFDDFEIDECIAILLLVALGLTVLAYFFLLRLGNARSKAS